MREPLYSLACEISHVSNYKTSITLRVPLCRQHTKSAIRTAANIQLFHPRKKNAPSFSTCSQESCTFAPMELATNNNEKPIATEETGFVEDIKQIVASAKTQAYRAANLMQVASNWLLGWRIVEQEQKGKARAEYGAYVIKLASEVLTAEFGKGYSITNIKSYRKFYLTFNNLEIGQTLPAQLKKMIQQAVPAESETSQTMSDQLPLQIGQTLSAQLTWSHYERLMRVDDEKARNWYLKEAAEQGWNVRTLDRNVSSQYYYRLLKTPDKLKHEVIDEMKNLTADYQKDKYAFIKNPIVAEFRGLPQNAAFTESKLERAIIIHLKDFLLELGKGFAFVAEQQHIRTEENDYFIDLVFYNYMLRCFVLIDLKTNKLSYQDVGQMDMYVQMYDNMRKQEGDNPTIGIILCSETDGDVVRYSTLAKNDQLFASKYLTFMPTEEQLRHEIEQQKELFLLNQQNNNQQ